MTNQGISVVSERALSEAARRREMQQQKLKELTERNAKRSIGGVILENLQMQLHNLEKERSYLRELMNRRSRDNNELEPMHDRVSLENLFNREQQLKQEIFALENELERVGIEESESSKRDIELLLS